MRRPSPRLCAVVVVVSLLLAGANQASSASPRAPAQLLGVNMHPLQYSYSSVDADRSLELASQLGVSVVRIDVHWGWFEYWRRGTANWDSWEVGWLDPFLAEAARRHIQVLATVLDTPCWASDETGRRCPTSPDGSSHYHGSYPPRSPANFAAFLRRFIAHVGTRIQYYEIWNEPDLTGFWLHPDPAAYTRLLRAAYPAIKAANPAAQVLAGATSGADVDFIEGMYRAGAKSYFDALSIHPYTGTRSPGDCSVTRKSLRCGVEAVHALMLRHEDTRPIWLTEFGQSVAEVTPDQQARYVTQALTRIRRWSYVRGALWYELFDDPHGHDGEHFGLFDSTLAPRAAAQAFAAALRNPSVVR